MIAIPLVGAFVATSAYAAVPGELSLPVAALLASAAPALVAVVGDRSARVVVRNHGSGVTPGDTEHIFEKFRQLDATSPGAGLGLFISRGLARAHGGDLTVQPATDAGSEFELRLPLPVL